MKKFILTAFLLVSSLAFSQGIRYDIGSPGSAGVVTTSGSGLPYLIALPGVTLNWCNYPANAAPCTNFASTYSSLALTTPCPTNQPIVLQGSSSCQGTSDNAGNLGVYTIAGTYSYTLTYGATTFGPFTVSVGGTGGGGGGGTVTQVNTQAPLTGGGFAISGTIGLANSGVTAGTYTNTNISVDAFGRVTSAANGSAPGADTYVLFNQGNAFSAKSNFTFNYTSNTLSVPNLSVTTLSDGCLSSVSHAVLSTGTPCGSGGGGGSGTVNAGVAVQQAVYLANGTTVSGQTKPVYDVRDYGFVCDGVTDNSAKATTLVSAIAGIPATVQMPVQHCGINSFVWPANVTLDFSPGGTLKPLTDSTTVPGTATYDSTAGATAHCEPAASTQCVMSVTAPANDTYLVALRARIQRWGTHSRFQCRERYSPPRPRIKHGFFFHQPVLDGSECCGRSAYFYGYLVRKFTRSLQRNSGQRGWPNSGIRRIRRGLLEHQR